MVEHIGRCRDSQGTAGRRRIDPRDLRCAARCRRFRRHVVTPGYGSALSSAMLRVLLTEVAASAGTQRLVHEYTRAAPHYCGEALLRRVRSTSKRKRFAEVRYCRERRFQDYANVCDSRRETAVGAAPGPTTTSERQDRAKMSGYRGSSAKSETSRAWASCASPPGFQMDWDRLCPPFIDPTRTAPRVCGHVRGASAACTTRRRMARCRFSDRRFVHVLIRDARAVLSDLLTCA